jgi:NADH-quinone oxidoreductase subunit G
MNTAKTLILNGREVEFSDERNLLEVIRGAGIDLPTFCYHSKLSIYGACRLCIVDVEGRGVMASCSTKPAPGMVIRTDTKEIRAMRKVNVELLLANHKRECPSCTRSSNCSLQDLARRLGVEEIRYKQRNEYVPVDKSSLSLERDPNKCVLCGDCVRVCSEVQGIGAIGFVNRGSSARVAPAFDQNLGEVECVNCGQCAAVCPTGAIVPRQNRDDVWNAIYDKNKTVVVQIAPAVRVALGEYFGFEPGVNVAGKLVNALKMMGFDQVYDTCFSADMTIYEEATEFIDRFTKKENLPLMTSCCPAWVKYAEIYHPEMLDNVSSCRSPQQMFGSVAKKVLPEQLNVDKKDLVVVSIMPCTAKKSEAALDKFKTDGMADVDYVLTTVEIGRMINSMGIDFNSLEPEAFDMPMGFSTGAGVIFGATGGVMEAALRYAVEKIEGKKLKSVDFKAVRGLDSLKEATLEVAGHEVKIAVVYGLKKAGELMEDIKNGKAKYDFIEIMACPGGCISGAGQPISHSETTRRLRAKGIYSADKQQQLKKSQENYLVDKCYAEHLDGKPGSHEAHKRLHTSYTNRSQIFDVKIPVLRGTQADCLQITVTVSAQEKDSPGKDMLAQIVDYVRNNGFADKVNIDAAFSSSLKAPGEICVTVGDEIIKPCDSNKIEFENIKKVISSILK